ncbi:hypothetical protein SDJN02_16840, partial [Cucurbita argyrosperma subsp. argyrosperma]
MASEPDTGRCANLLVVLRRDLQMVSESDTGRCANLPKGEGKSASKDAGPRRGWIVMSHRGSVPVKTLGPKGGEIWGSVPHRSEERKECHGGREYDVVRWGPSRRLELTFHLFCLQKSASHRFSGGGQDLSINAVIALGDPKDATTRVQHALNIEQYEIGRELRTKLTEFSSNLATSLLFTVTLASTWFTSAAKVAPQWNSQDSDDFDWWFAPISGLLCCIDFCRLVALSLLRGDFLNTEFSMWTLWVSLETFHFICDFFEAKSLSRLACFGVHCHMFSMVPLWIEFPFSEFTGCIADVVLSL